MRRDNIHADAVGERADEAFGCAVDPCGRLGFSSGADHAVEVRDDLSRFHESRNALLDGGDQACSERSGRPAAGGEAKVMGNMVQPFGPPRERSQDAFRKPLREDPSRVRRPGGSGPLRMFVFRRIFL